mmetsp:Transcript_26430/g.73931  ORF Transcript_26430/g.73931 Transcript_26430/m.73931 type:complete len:251 (-) Transcript_26430:1128-1880(-)
MATALNLTSAISMSSSQSRMRNLLAKSLYSLASSSVNFDDVTDLVYVSAAFRRRSARTTLRSASCRILTVIPPMPLMLRRLDTDPLAHRFDVCRDVMVRSSPSMEECVLDALNDLPVASIPVPSLRDTSSSLSSSMGSSPLFGLPSSPTVDCESSSTGAVMAVVSSDSAGCCCVLFLSLRLPGLTHGGSLAPHELGLTPHDLDFRFFCSSSLLERAVRSSSLLLFVAAALLLSLFFVIPKASSSSSESSP